MQIELSDAAISVLNPGGIFGFATCSPHFAETSSQVKAILKAHPEVEHVDITQYLPVGLDNAVRDGSLSLWGHRHNTDSMFLALFKKKN
jgi:16S rRNA (cytosine967-C5)-methyltransferase